MFRFLSILLVLLPVLFMLRFPNKTFLVSKFYDYFNLRIEGKTVFILPIIIFVCFVIGIFLLIKHYKKRRLLIILCLTLAPILLFKAYIYLFVHDVRALYYNQKNSFCEIGVNKKDGHTGYCQFQITNRSNKEIRFKITISDKNFIDKDLREIVREREEEIHTAGANTTKVFELVFRKEAGSASDVLSKKYSGINIDVTNAP